MSTLVAKTSIQWGETGKTVGLQIFKTDNTSAVTLTTQEDSTNYYASPTYDSAWGPVLARHWSDGSAKVIETDVVNPAYFALLAKAGDAMALTTGQRVKLDATQPDLSPATATQGNGILAAISSLANQTDTSLAVVQQLIAPATGTALYSIEATFTDADNAHALLDMTSVALTCTNSGGTSRSARLSSASHPATGVYRWTYTATAGDAEEGLLFTVVGTKSGDPGQWRNSAAANALNAAIIDFDASDRATLAAIALKTQLIPPEPASAGDVATVAAAVEGLATPLGDLTTLVSTTAATTQSQFTIIQGHMLVNDDPRIDFLDKPLSEVGGGGTILGPVVAQLPPGIDLRGRRKIAVAQYASVRQSVDVYDAAGALAASLEGRAFRFVIFDENGTGVVQIDDDDIERDDAAAYRLYVEIPTTATQEAGGLLWQLWDVSDPSKPQDMGRGPFNVEVSCLQVT